MSSDNDIDAIRKKKYEEMMKNAHNVVKMPESVVEVNSVEQLNKMLHNYKDGLLIIDFWAEWCGPCKMFSPHYEALQQEYASEGKPVVFTKINVDHNQEIAGEFNVTAIPTTTFIHNRKIAYNNMGMVPKDSFKQIIDAILEKLSIKN